MDKIIANDGKGLVKLLGLDEGTLKHVGNYQFMATKKQEDIMVFAEPTDESNEYIKVLTVYIGAERHKYCKWCGELVPISEMRKEKNLGYLCDTCQRAIASRGEKLTYLD